MSNSKTASNLSRFWLCIYSELNFGLHVEYICYDDGYHLRKYARNKNRCDETPTAKTLAQIIIDKIDKWCNYFKLKKTPEKYDLQDKPAQIHKSGMPLEHELPKTIALKELKVRQITSGNKTFWDVSMPQGQLWLYLLGKGLT